MAGSYRHITNEDGTFCGVDLIDNLGDAYEALEECYDMITWLSGGDKDRVAAAWARGHIKRVRPELTEKEIRAKAAEYWSLG